MRILSLVAVALALLSPTLPRADGCADSDGDGVCDVLDNCPTQPNPDQGGPVKLSDGLAGGGNVENFTLTGDGQWAVYRADDVVDGQFELLSAPLEGGAVERLNAVPVAGGDVITYTVGGSPPKVAFAADLVTDAQVDLYAVSASGGIALKLDGPNHQVNTSWPLRITPAGDRVVYVAGPGFGNAVYSVSSNSAESVLLPSGPLHQAPLLTPDGNYILFVGESSSTLRLWRYDHAGWPMELATRTLVGSPWLRTVAVTGDNAWVVYESGNLLPPQQSDGLAGRQLVEPWAFANYESASAGVVFCGVTPEPVDGSYRVVSHWFFAMQSTTIDGLSEIALGTGDCRGLTRDGLRVLYTSDEVHRRLYAVSVLGGAPVQLAGPMVENGKVEAIDSTPDGARIVFLADSELNGRFELYSVPTTGGAVVKLNLPLPIGGDVDKFLVTPDGSTVLYLAGQDVPSRFELYAVPVAGGTPRKLNDPLADGGSVRDDFASTPDGRFVVYRAEQDTAGVVELYRVEIAADGDADGTFDVCDCATGDAASWSTPSECRELRLHQNEGVTSLRWDAPEVLGAAELAYDVLRTDEADGFSSGAAEILCAAVDLEGLTATDGDVPLTVFYYLVRGGNTCGEGAVGEGREAAAATVCP